MTHITIDLNHCRTKKSVLEKFGTDLFGEYGMNWDAFVDCMRSLDTGDISGDQSIYPSPIILTITQSRDFQESDPENYALMIDILKEQELEWKEDGKILEIIII